MSETTVETAIVSLLKQTPVIWNEVNSRITPQERDKDGLFPAIVYSGSLPQRTKYLDGSYTDIGTVEMGFEVWATTWMKAKILAANVTAVLASYTGTIDGQTIMDISIEPGQEDADPDGNVYVVEFVATITCKFAT